MEALKAVPVPQTMRLGPAELLSSLQYRCNGVHRIWPIEVVTHLPFTVRE